MFRYCDKVISEIVETKKNDCAQALKAESEFGKFRVLFRDIERPCKKTVCKLKKIGLNEVYNFWNSESCGERYAIGEDDKEKLISETKCRYDLEPCIKSIAEFEKFRGSRRCSPQRLDVEYREGAVSKTLDNGIS